MALQRVRRGYHACMVKTPAQSENAPAAMHSKTVAHKPVKSEPYLSVYFSPALHKKVLSVIEVLEASPEPEQHRAALSDAIVELMNGGMDYCFVKPLKLAKPGFIIEQSASLGLSGALQILGSVIRNIIGRMNAPQLISVCGSIRKLMRSG